MSLAIPIQVGEGEGTVRNDPHDMAFRLFGQGGRGGG